MAEPPRNKTQAKKRPPSHSQPTRSSMRIRVAQRAQSAQSVTSRTASQTQSKFLELPLEVRDRIYAAIIGPLSMRFRWKETMIFCKPSLQYTCTAAQPWGSSRGLPLWLLTCKQILAEALDHIARTHAFGESGSVDHPERELSALPNSLIFCRHGIRTINLYRRIKYAYDGQYRYPYTCPDWERSTYFLDSLEELGVRDVALDVEWNFRKIDVYPYSYKGPLRHQFSDRNACWARNFRKVTISIVYHYGRVIQQPSQ
jgi:hypothetical protein